MKTYKELLESLSLKEEATESLDERKKIILSLDDIDWLVDELSQQFPRIKPIVWGMLKKALIKTLTEKNQMGEEISYTPEEVKLFELDDEAFEAVVKKRSASDRKKDVKKRKKWLKTSGGKKSLKKSKKRADKVKRGSIRVDKKKAKLMKKVKKVYK